jgi:hypothetical protein
VVFIGKKVANYSVSLDRFLIDLVKRRWVVPPVRIIGFGDDDLTVVVDSFSVSPARAFPDAEIPRDQASPKVEQVAAVGDRGTRTHLDQEGDHVGRRWVASPLMEYVAVEGAECFIAHLRVGIK